MTAPFRGFFRPAESEVITQRRVQLTEATSHIVVLDANTTAFGGACRQYQMYEGSWSTSSGLSGYDAVVANLNIPYSTQFTYMDDNITTAGIPLLGFTDFGPDLLSANIKHPIQLIMLKKHVVCFQGTASCTNPQPLYGVNYATNLGADGSCSPNSSTDPSNCFVYGDIFRLKSNYTCPTDSVSLVVCQQLKKRGMVLSDTGEEGNLRFGLDENGVDDTGPDLFPWLSKLTFNNFDVITRGAITPNGTITGSSARIRRK